MSILRAAGKVQLKYTTARNIINEWKKLHQSVDDSDGNRSDNAHSGDEGARVADFTRQR